MGIPSGWELVILLVVLVLLFGATKLPTAARSIGQSIRIFKAETKGARSEEEASAPAPAHQSLPPSGPAAAGINEPQVNEPQVDEPRRDNDTRR
jgi:sec-independent protein translocase protein TatA